MGELLERHLDTVAGRMGGFLRGFDNPRVHIGSTARFAAEFRKVLRYPALHPPGESRLISYAAAATTYHAPLLQTAANVAADPVYTMICGLSGPMVLSSGIHQELPLDTLRSDLSSLLRVPILRFYLQVSDREAFQVKLEEISGKGGFSLVTGAIEPQGAGLPCPSCRSLLSRESLQAGLGCGACGQKFEYVTPLPMVSGLAAVVSYEMLRKLVALDLVECYQEEGNVVPLESGSETR